MNELRRMTYLDAAGIDMFVPRFVLPNAPVAKQCELPAPKTDSAFANDNAKAATSLAVGLDSSKRTQSGGAPSSIAALLDTSAKPEVPTRSAQNEAPSQSTNVAPKATVISNDEKPEPVVAETPVEEIARFHLTLWKTDTGLQIIDSSDPQDALPTPHLLSNILIANQLINTQLGQQELFRWPVNNHKGSASWDGARSFMADFFDGRFQQKQARAILAFGEDACRSLLSIDGSFPEMMFSSQQHPVFNIPVIVLPALKTLLYEPSRKAGIWQALETLRSV